MSTIIGIEYYTAFSPLKRPASIAYGKMVGQDPVIVRVSSSNGIGGYGEVPGSGVLNYGGYTQEGTIRNLKENFSPKLIGQDPTYLAKINWELDRPVTRSQEHREIHAKAALDMALHDLAGKILRVPVYVLLGGSFRSKIEFCGVLYGESPDQVAKDAVDLVNGGITSLKIKVGMAIEEDLERIKRVREAVGDGVCLWFDPNEQWTLKRTIDVLRKTHRYGLEYCEQPTPGWDIRALAEVRKLVAPDVKIIADQSVFSIHDAKTVLSLEAVDVINVKPSRFGLYRARQIALLAESHDVDCKLGYGGEMGIGSACGLHFAASIPNFDEKTSELHLNQYTTTLVKGLEHDEGNIWKVPERAGLGVDVIDEMLKRVIAD